MSNTGKGYTLCSGLMADERSLSQILTIIQMGGVSPILHGRAVERSGTTSPLQHSPNQLSVWFALFRYPLSWGLRPQTPVMRLCRVTFGMAQLSLLTIVSAWIMLILTVPVALSILWNDADQNGSFFCLNLFKSINTSVSEYKAIPIDSIGFSKGL